MRCSVQFNNATYSNILNGTRNTRRIVLPKFSATTIETQVFNV